jgi:hypothetical protein
MKRFDNTKLKYSYLFKYGALLINSLHRKRMDLIYKVIGDNFPNLENYKWDGDF